MLSQMQAPLLSSEVRGELPDQSACAHGAANLCGNLLNLVSKAENPRQRWVTQALTVMRNLIIVLDSLLKPLLAKGTLEFSKELRG